MKLEKFQNKYIYLLIIILIIFLVLIYFLFKREKHQAIEFFNTNSTLNKIDNIIDNSVVIVGCARNIETFLDKTIEVIKSIRSCFRDSRVIIYENDSNDKTLEKLQSWALYDDKIDIITEKNVPGLRTQRLSHGRNIVMNKALKYDSELIIVMDLDIINHDLTKDIFLSSFKNFAVNDWAGMFANQTEKYYDLYALRTKDNWMPFDFYDCLKEKSNDWDYCLHSRFKKILPTDAPIDVVSAFGGLGIYKTQFIKNAKYYGGINDKEECEHVSFNKDIIKNGGKLYINPLMLNSSGLSN